MRFDCLKAEYLPEIAQIERESFATPWTEAMYAPDVEDENAIYAVGIDDGGEVICYGGFHKVLDEAHITNIAVRERDRGRGYGAALMSKLIELAKQSNIARMTLEVRDGNERAVGLYKSFGFSVEGIRKRYYENRFDALVMWLTIEEG